MKRTLTLFASALLVASCGNGSNENYGPDSNDETKENFGPDSVNGVKENFGPDS